MIVGKVALHGAVCRIISVLGEDLGEDVIERVIIF